MKRVRVKFDDSSERYQATVLLHFQAKDLDDARATIDAVLAGGVAETDACFTIKSVRRERQETVDAVSRSTGR